MGIEQDTRFEAVYGLNFAPPEKAGAFQKVLDVI